MSRPAVLYKVQIPDVILRDPVQAVVDAFTVIHQRGGIEMCDAALLAALEVIHPSETS